MLVVVAMAACGGDRDDEETVERWCGRVEDLADFVEENAGGDIDVERLDEQIAEIESLRTDVTDGAPGSIADDVRVLFDTPSDTRDLDEQQAEDEARDKVNAYIRDECRLDVTL